MLQSKSWSQILQYFYIALKEATLSEYTGYFYSVHDIDASTVRSRISEIQSANGWPSHWNSIDIRDVDGLIHVIDGVHRAVACCVMSVPAYTNNVSENQFLSDDDIRNSNRETIATIASRHQV
jgi:hypothetical protein